MSRCVISKLRVRQWLLLAVAFFCLLPIFANADEAATSLEYKVKAGYIFNFAKFVEWPASALPQTDSPIIIGVVDAGTALSLIQNMLEGKNVNGHSIQVIALSPEYLGTNCHIIYVGKSGSTTPKQLRQLLAGTPTLLVGESNRFAEDGGMVGFTRDKENIRIKLNLDAAIAASLKVDSKLSSVAKLVKEGDAS